MKNKMVDAMVKVIVDSCREDHKITHIVVDDIYDDFRGVYILCPGHKGPSGVAHIVEHLKDMGFCDTGVTQNMRVLLDDTYGVTVGVFDEEKNRRGFIRVRDELRNIKRLIQENSVLEALMDVYRPGDDLKSCLGKVVKTFPMNEKEFPWKQGENEGAVGDETGSVGGTESE